jgi:hypothetical protein
VLPPERVIVGSRASVSGHAAWLHAARENLTDFSMWCGRTDCPDNR